MLFSITRGRNNLWKKIYLHIDETEKITLGKRIIFSLVKILFSVEILIGKNKGPHSKYYTYLLHKFNNQPFILLDDDMFYSKKEIKKLIKYGLQNECNTALRCVRVETLNGKFQPYKSWQPVYRAEQSFELFATNVGGTFITVKFAKYVLRNLDQVYLFPSADDVFFYFISLKYKMPYITLDGYYDPILIPFTQINALWKKNVENGGNDTQLKVITDLLTLSKYGFK
jgi:hypothetical protein